ncbi:hypothetical protein NQ314_003719 [Rhamnusium bicolor]|uniref:Signal recognition particle receptor alpha subunit N-terminal domain-containing protein n=1 Tax=Rhamnusium bicolor TaxID=1586634 RepID=A0AAV8ZNF8_9CUCU|nr:hypothetical protein NQ314_003719 [Rhamnusium bicolor]
MLDLFTIFSKGGIVLWCFQSTNQIFTSSVNALIRNVILQERTGVNTFDHNGLSLQYKLDNEFDLVFVVAYQKILQLSYVDKFLNDIHLEFRDKYKNELTDGKYFLEYDFVDTYNDTLQAAEEWSKLQSKLPKQMRTFEESVKSKKTVASMIERKGEEKLVKTAKKKEVNFRDEGIIIIPRNKKVASPLPPFSPKSQENGLIDEETLVANRAKLAKKLQKKKPETK